MKDIWNFTHQESIYFQNDQIVKYLNEDNAYPAPLKINKY